MQKGILERTLNRFGFEKESESVPPVITGSSFSTKESGGDLIQSAVTMSGATGLSTMETSYQSFVNSYTSWVYTSINKIMWTVATLPLVLYKYTNSTGKVLAGPEIKSWLKNIKDKEARSKKLLDMGIEKEAIFSHPFYDLLKKPNALSTRMILWMDIMCRLELTGSCALYLVKNGLGTPQEMWVLPLRASADFKIVPSATEVIKGYLYTDGSLRQEFAPDEIVFMKYPNPATPFKGKSALIAQSGPYNIDKFITQQQNSIFRNNAQLGTVFTTDLELQEAQITKIKADLTKDYVGTIKAGKPLVLHSGLKRDKDVMANARNMMLKDISQYARDKILSGYDVSAGKLGLVEDVNRANLEGLNKSYYQDNIKPRTMLIEEYFEADILPLYDERLTADFDLPEFEEKELILKQRESNLKTGYTSINEERMKDGLAEVEWGEAPWLPLGMSQVTARGAGNADTPSDDDADDQKVFSVLKKGYDKEHALALWKQFEAHLDEWEAIITKVMRKHFAEQGKAVLGKLEGKAKRLAGMFAGWGQKKIYKFMNEHKDRISEINISKQKWTKILEDEITPATTLVFKEAGQLRINMLVEDGFLESEKAKAVSAEYGIVFDFDDEEAQKWLGTRIETMSKEVTNTTFEKIKAVLKDGFAEGMPTSTIAETLSEKFVSWEKFRAPLIARTETTAAANTADLQAVEQEGLKDVLNKTWLTAGDEEVRATHLQAGEKYKKGIALNKEFQVGEDSMLSPGNGKIAKENVQCRCGMAYVEK